MAKLGTSKIGTQELSIEQDTVFTTPTNGDTEGRTLTSEIGVDVTTTPTPSSVTSSALLPSIGIETTVSPTTATSDTPTGLKPVVLNPENLGVTFDRERSVFVSNWFEETTPVADGVHTDVVVTSELRSDDPLTVVIERDDTGDGRVDARSETHTTCRTIRFYRRC